MCAANRITVNTMPVNKVITITNMIKAGLSIAIPQPVKAKNSDNKQLMPIAVDTA